MPFFHAWPLGATMRSAVLRSPVLLSAALVLLAAIARFWGLGFGLPHTYARPDETIVIDVALRFLRGHFSPDFYDYPPLFMVALALLYLGYFAVGWMTGRFASVGDLVASWGTEWTPFFLIARGLSATLGVLSVLLLYRLAARLFDRTVAAVAAGFLAVALLHVRDSHFGTTDVAVTFFVLWSLLALDRAQATGAWRHFAVAGLLAGLAAATKYSGALVVVAGGACLVLSGAHGAWRRQAVAYAAACAGAFLAAAPHVWLEHERFLEAMRLLFASMAGGMGPERIESGWWHHLSVSLRHGLGLPLLAAGLAGLGGLAWRDWRKAVFVGVFPLAYFAVAGASQNVFARYMVPVVPLLCLSAGWAVATVVRGVVPLRAPGPATLVTGLVAAAVAWPSAADVVRLNRLLAAEDTRVLAARWLDRTLPAGSSLLQAGSHYGHVQLARYRELSLWVWHRHERAFLVDGSLAAEPDRPEWVVLQQSPLPYSVPQPWVMTLLREGYSLVERFVGHSPSAHNPYDYQDAFFLPLARFAGVKRPGPNLFIYQRLAPGQPVGVVQTASTP